MNGVVSSVRYRDPRLSRDENDCVWPRQGPFIANCYCDPTFLQDKHFLRIMVLVEINDGAGIQILRQHNEVFGPPILLVDLNDEFRNGTWSTRPRLSDRAA